MLSNYIKTALRNIARNKLYAAINILGLAMGLAIYVFGGLFYDYEHSHDKFFKNSDRIYTLGSDFPAQEEYESSTMNVVYTALTPIIKSELSDVEQVARTFLRSFLLTTDDNNYYQTLHFADSGLLRIFNFDYIYGDEKALDNTNGAVITESIAQKFFPDQNPMGKVISINHEHDIHVTAVIKDLPQNTHFNSNFIIDRPLQIIVPIHLIKQLEGREVDENWGELSTGNITYVMLPKNLDQKWLQSQMNGIYERHYPEDEKKTVSGISVFKLISVNSEIWDEIGIPALTIIKILGIFILIIACLNYTNLATAQSLNRTREVGLRKTLGAAPLQLLSQFIVESLTLTLIAMVVTLSVLELLIPPFNEITGKSLTLNYVQLLPWLSMTVLIVGILAGCYPAYLVTKTNPTEALRENMRKGKASAWIRGTMIAVQFTISVFMLALVLVVYSQNKLVEKNSNIFPNSQIYTLDRIGIDQIVPRHETLKNEMLKINGVENFSYSSQVPFEGFRNRFTASTIISDISSGFMINQMVADHDFLNTYNIPIVAGRQTTDDIAMDTHVRARGAVNVMINELAAKKFGFPSAQDAVGEMFYEDEGDRGITTYTIVGVIKDQNIYGLQNRIVPFVYFARDASYRHASIKLSPSATLQTITDIKDTWNRIIPDYPLQASFLDNLFQEQFMLFDLSAKSLASFTIFALFLALIGLFGLAAFMAEQRTKEIGIRKVLGANTGQIIKLLIWQFSKPVLWATPFALLLAYFASRFYLEYFPDRISMPYTTLIAAGLAGLLLSWATVATHAYKVARTNPVNALHYE
ncbi:MAG: ABC transporter permease [Kordiimonadaceae bacterium]|nr:ABC transporter permease [Kordiimonadaceae bacterium]